MLYPCVLCSIWVTGDKSSVRGAWFGRNAASLSPTLETEIRKHDNEFGSKSSGVGAQFTFNPCIHSQTTEREASDRI